MVIPSLNEGGMQRVMSELAGYFSGRNEFEVHIVLYGPTPEIFYSLPSNLDIHKPLTAFEKNGRFLFIFKRLIYLRKTIQRIKPDSILSFGEYWNSFVLLALYGLHFKLFISDRCSPVKKFSYHQECLRKWLYPKASGVVAQTQIAKMSLEKWLNPDKVFVIGNPIRTFKSNPHLPRQNIVLTIGRLIETKHHDKLIEMFSKIDNQNWKLVIVGDDALGQKLMEKLRRQILESGMTNRIFLVGKQKDVDFYYQTSKIFAFASSSEGFPNVIGEAMAAGLPVISFNCVAGPSEMIKNNENGFLVPLFDLNDYIAKLKILMDDGSIRKLFAMRARMTINAFNINSIGEQYMKVLFGN